LQRVVEQPELYPSVHRTTRRILIHRFPFGVFYRVEMDSVVVVAVMHGSRDPQRWKQRI
jgi:plasmid stabilization system protein ParE